MLEQRIHGPATCPRRGIWRARTIVHLQVVRFPAGLAQSVTRQRDRQRLTRTEKILLPRASHEEHSLAKDMLKSDRDFRTGDIVIVVLRLSTSVCGHEMWQDKLQGLL